VASGIDACTPRTKSAGYHSLGTWSRPLESRDRDYGLPPAACVESGAVCGSWFEQAFARGNRQIVFEFHQPQEQRGHSKLFDEPDRLFSGYPGQLSFALFWPFLKALFHPKEINFDCRRTGLARFQFLEIGINAERE
jgi:hypothetical protein